MIINQVLNINDYKSSSQYYLFLKPIVSFCRHPAKYLLPDATGSPYLLNLLTRALLDIQINPSTKMLYLLIK